MFEINNISRDFKKGKKTRKALSAVSFKIADSGMLCICGKSGSGKSTLLNIIGLQDDASSGQILYNGKDICHFNEQQKNTFRQKTISRVSQDYDLINSFNVYDNCALALDLSGSGNQEIHERIMSALKTVGLSGYEYNPVNQMSGGEKQRVAIARALAKDTRVLLCDEPTGNLDPETSEEIMTILKKMSENICVIVVTHNRMLAEKHADRLIYISDGQIVSDNNNADFDRSPISESCENVKDTGFLSEGTDQKKKAPHERHLLSLKYILKFSWLNFKVKPILSISILMLMSILLSLFLSLAYMSDYSKARAISATMKDCGIYSTMMMPYREKLSKTGPNVDFIGGIVTTDSAKAQLSEKFHNLKFGEVYSYGRNFCDFSDIRNLEPGFFHCTAFTDFIVMQDFEEFPYQLMSGCYPEDKNEVVIFDYMANNLIYHSVFDDVQKFDDLLGYVLTDQVTGFTMKISGLLKSTYKDFEYIGDSTKTLFRNPDYYLANSCLSVFRCIYGGPEFVEKMENEKQSISSEIFEFSYSSVGYSNTKTLESTSESEIVQKTNTVKSESTYTLLVKSTEMAKSLGFSILYSTNEYGGVLMQDTVLAELLEIEVEGLTEGCFASLMPLGGEPSDIYTSSNISEFSDVLGAELYTSFYTSHLLINGVFHSDSDNPPAVLILTDDYERYSHSGNNCGSVLMLTDSESKNVDIISELLPISHDISYWNDDETKTINGVGIYTYINNAISNMNEYLEITNGLYEEYAWILLIFITFALFIYITVSVKKDRRAVGILRSVGASRTVVMLIYSSIALTVTVLALIIGVFGSSMLIRLVNNLLSSEYGGHLSLYSVLVNSVLSSAVALFVSVALAMLSVFIWLIVRKPISLIYERKE